VQLPDDLFQDITGTAVAIRSGKRDSRRLDYAASVFLFPIKGGRTLPAELADATDISPKGIGFTTSTAMTVGDSLAIRLMTRRGTAVLIQCVVRRTYPVSAGTNTVGADFVRVLKDTRAAA
jgi:hypothetical protein